MKSKEINPVPGSGFRVPGLTYHPLHIAFRISHFAYRISHFALRTSHFASRLIHFSLLPAFLLVLSSCTERIDVKLDETYTRLVVDGAIATDTSAYSIILTKTADYFYNNPSPVVTNATIRVTDGDSIWILHETQPGSSGIYMTDTGFYGKTGKQYTLQIELEDPIDDHTFYTSSCFLSPVARLDSIQVGFQPDWGKEVFWEIKCFAQEPGNETNYYMFNLFRNDTLITDSITKVSISDDKYINGSYIRGAGVIYIDNSYSWMRLHAGDKVTLKMSGITKEYYNFISQVQFAGFNIPFFQGPPANVEGNISDGGVGFFAAYSNSYASTTVGNISP
jgi:hypothetical protein